MVYAKNSGKGFLQYHLVSPFSEQRHLTAAAEKIRPCPKSISVASMRSCEIHLTVVRSSSILKLERRKPQQREEEIEC